MSKSFLEFQLGATDFLRCPGTFPLERPWSSALVPDTIPELLTSKLGGEPGLWETMEKTLLEGTLCGYLEEAWDAEHMSARGNQRPRDKVAINGFLLGCVCVLGDVSVKFILPVLPFIMSALEFSLLVWDLLLLLFPLSHPSWIHSSFWPTFKCALKARFWMSEQLEMQWWAGRTWSCPHADVVNRVPIKHP